MSISVPKAALRLGTLYEHNGFRMNQLAYHVPIDYKLPEGEHINVTVRVVIDRGVGEATLTPKILQTNTGHKLADKPFAVYLGSGPGIDNPPTACAAINNFYLDRGFQILYMDPRGTGDSMNLRGDTKPMMGALPSEQARILGLCRQDNIVRDLEAVRQAVGCSKWTLVAQSYGGSVAYSYLSFYPGSLREVFITGGLPPVGEHPDTIHCRTFQSTLRACEAYYKRYPEDVQRVREIVSHIVVMRGNGILRPSGGIISAERFLGIGRLLAFSDGEKKVHEEVTRCLADLATRVTFSEDTLKAMEKWLPFEDRPVYALLREPTYIDDGVLSEWSAYRVSNGLEQYWWLHGTGERRLMTNLMRACFQTDARLMARFESEPLYFTGEHVFPFHMWQVGSLRPLRGAADILAQKTDWDPLFDPQQLRLNTVPIAAVSYRRDIIVDSDLARNICVATGNIRHEMSQTLSHTAIEDRTNKVLPWTWGMLHKPEDKAAED